MNRVGVGVIGCGNISAAYLTAAKRFPILEIVAPSDANAEAAEARAAGAILGAQKAVLMTRPTLPRARLAIPSVPRAWRGRARVRPVYRGRASRGCRPRSAAGPYHRLTHHWTHG